MESQIKILLVDANETFASQLASVLGPVSYTHLDVYKRQALRVVVPAADALTASDKQDTAARNNARIRFFCT